MKMHQTTLRFTPELWETLELEAAAAGVSVAQYVREAALARVMYTLGRHGDDGFDAVLDAVSEDAAIAEAQTRAERTRQEAVEAVDSSAALWAQARQARARARELGSNAARTREKVSLSG